MRHSEYKFGYVNNKSNINNQREENRKMGYHEHTEKYKFGYANNKSNINIQRGENRKRFTMNRSNIHIIGLLAG